jgi:hypothetical protein
MYLHDIHLLLIMLKCLNGHQWYTSPDACCTTPPHPTQAELKAALTKALEGCSALVSQPLQKFTCSLTAVVKLASAAQRAACRAFQHP